MPEGTQEYEYKLGKQFFVNMENSDIHDADITVNLTVTHKSDLYDLQFFISGELELMCASVRGPLIENCRS